MKGRGVAAERIDSVVSERLTEERANPSVGVVTRVVGGNGNGDEVDQVARMVPGIMVMFLMFALTMGAQTLVEERQNRTLERLMTTRLSVNGLFAGKFLAGVLRATAQAAILLALAFVALRIGGAADFGRLMAFSVLVAADGERAGSDHRLGGADAGSGYLVGCGNHDVHDGIRRYLLRRFGQRRAGRAISHHAYAVRA